MTLQKVGVIGCGLMGFGIAQVCAVAGHLMKRRVPAGLHGRKTGEGFCDDSDPKNPHVNRIVEA